MGAGIQPDYSHLPAGLVMAGNGEMVNLQSAAQSAWQALTSTTAGQYTLATGVQRGFSTIEFDLSTPSVGSHFSIDQNDGSIFHVYINPDDINTAVLVPTYSDAQTGQVATDQLFDFTANFIIYHEVAHITGAPDYSDINAITADYAKANNLDITDTAVVNFQNTTAIFRSAYYSQERLDIINGYSSYAKQIG